MAEVLGTGRECPERDVSCIFEMAERRLLQGRIGDKPDKSAHREQGRMQI